MSDVSVILNTYNIINRKQVSAAVIDYYREEKKELPTFSDYAKTCAEVSTAKYFAVPKLSDMKLEWVKLSRRAIQDLQIKLWQRGIF